MHGSQFWHQLKYLRALFDLPVFKKNSKKFNIELEKYVQEANFLKENIDSIFEKNVKISLRTCPKNILTVGGLAEKNTFVLSCGNHKSRRPFYCIERSY